MNTELKYKIIKDKAQYDEYCQALELLLTLSNDSDVHGTT